MHNKILALGKIVICHVPQQKRTANKIIVVHHKDNARQTLSTCLPSALVANRSEHGLIRY
jgi:hypothetical protein